MTLLMIGTTELILIAVLALLLFGGKKLPEMMRGLGQGVREFKKGVNTDEEAQKQGGQSTNPKGNDTTQTKESTPQQAEHE